MITEKRNEECNCFVYMVIGVYLCIAGIAFGVGIISGGDDQICHKPPSRFGKYTGLAYIVNFGCYMGESDETKQ